MDDPVVSDGRNRQRAGWHKELVRDNPVMRFFNEAMAQNPARLRIVPSRSAESPQRNCRLRGCAAIRADNTAVRAGTCRLPKVRVIPEGAASCATHRFTNPPRYQWLVADSVRQGAAVNGGLRPSGPSGPSSIST